MGPSPVEGSIYGGLLRQPEGYGHYSDPLPNLTAGPDKCTLTTVTGFGAARDTLQSQLKGADPAGGPREINRIKGKIQSFIIRPHRGAPSSVRSDKSGMSR
ncbi:hypothetical protein EVAR_99916_1 [Eumeta japonica]|uniref:Uncharacterized protein n=1 Tax=Eumeta variegata TaxID=151549 RepID=A0A4C2AA71_EUMVA|nr:hypothetical protein EVAR_99916_1 [Eumeta japonica]